MMADEKPHSILDLLVVHEWSYAEGWKIYCQTCGMKHREGVKHRTHKKDCLYAKALKDIRSLPLI
jgi:hypothetical protein